MPENKNQIEKVFGEDLSWERLDNKKASRIKYLIEDIGLKDKDEWSKLQDIMIEKMILLEKAMRPFIEDFER